MRKLRSPKELVQVYTATKWQNLNSKPIVKSFCWDDEKVMERNSSDGCTALWICLTYWMLHLQMVKMVNFILCVFLLFFSCSVVSDSLRPHGLQHARLPCPSPTPRACSNSCSSSRWCHPTISSSAVPFSSCLQSFPASGSFSMSWLFASGGQSIRASTSASVLPMNIQDWFPLGWTGLISLQSKTLSKVFPNTTVQKHQFFNTQPSLSLIHTWLLEKP